MRTAFVLCALLLGSLPSLSSAAIAHWNQFRFDFTKSDEAREQATWSDADKLTITEQGLGWDGAKDASRFGWIELKPLAVGLSWRPAQSVSIRLTVKPVPKTIQLPTGYSTTPQFGRAYARHSPDGKHWSNWQSLRQEREKDKADAVRTFIGSVDIPRRDRSEYELLSQEYQKLDVPWKSDEEALVDWILTKEPEYFRDHRPFIGYVQILFEQDFYAGQRIDQIDVELGFALDGHQYEPRDKSILKERQSAPWRFRAK
jgi:hypothetical protein